MKQKKVLLRKIYYLTFFTTYRPPVYHFVVCQNVRINLGYHMLKELWL